MSELHKKEDFANIAGRVAINGEIGLSEINEPYMKTIAYGDQEKTKHA
jgi:hypothetical protein